MADRRGASRGRAPAWGEMLTERQIRAIHGFMVPGFTRESIRKAAGWQSPNGLNIALKCPAFRRALDRARREQAERVQINADRLVLELWRIALANITDVVGGGEDGISIRSLDSLPPQVKAAVAEVTQRDTADGRQIRVKMAPKLQAIEALLKHLGAAGPDRLELSGPDGGPVRVDTVSGLSTDELVEIIKGVADDALDEGGT